MFVSEGLNGLLQIPHYAAVTCLIVAKVYFPTFWPSLWTIFKSFPFLISFFYFKNNPLRYVCRFATTLLWPLHLLPEKAQIYQFRPGAPPSREATSLPDLLVSRKRTAFSYCTPCFPRGTEGKVRKVIYWHGTVEHEYVWDSQQTSHWFLKLDFHMKPKKNIKRPQRERRSS